MGLYFAETPILAFSLSSKSSGRQARAIDWRDVIASHAALKLLCLKVPAANRKRRNNARFRCIWLRTCRELQTLERLSRNSTVFSPQRGSGNRTSLLCKHSNLAPKRSISRTVWQTAQETQNMVTDLSGPQITARSHRFKDPNTRPVLKIRVTTHRTDSDLVSQVLDPKGMLPPGAYQSGTPASRGPRSRGSLHKNHDA